MSGLVITVDFTIKPGCMSAFRQLMDANAIASCRDEPGCRRFDVLVPADDADRIFLYEIYDDRAAFEAHLKSPHFIRFDRDSADLVLDKRGAQFTLTCEGSRT